MVGDFMVRSRQTNMAANNYYGFSHAGAQYGYTLIFILMRAVNRHYMSFWQQHILERMSLIIHV